MKKVGIVIGKNKDINYIYTNQIAEKLLERGVEVIVAPAIKDSLNTDVTETDSVYRDSDFIICVGGDGTFLKAARGAFPYKKPLLGVNKGTVGFLAEVETGEIDMAIDKIVAGQYHIQPRMVLDVEVIRNGKSVYKNIAINDAVVSRMALSRIIRLKVMMDGEFVDSYASDGVIVSTPTGSTGYSLSAGGPIVAPDMRLMLVSPICPHILYSRSFIIADTKTITISIAGSKEVDAILTLDGQEGFPIEPNDIVSVRASKDSVFFATVKQVNFYDVLRAKIHNT
ncbi:MAG TPA: NAD(+)/NADH kinase [Clostridiaceae bacterium]|nr:NAD(+)/NADH kinase [Clostridiaceae bacterium]